MSEQQLRNAYRLANRKRRDEMWCMYIGMRPDFQTIEDAAKNKCPECGHNPHTVYCSQHQP